MYIFFIMDLTNSQMLIVEAENLEHAQLAVTKQHGLNRSAQEPLFGGTAWTREDCERHGIELPAEVTV